MQYEAIPQQCRDIVLVAKCGGGLIIAFNRAAVEAYGYTADELASMQMRDLYPHGRTGSDAVTSSSGQTLEAFHRRKDGTLFPVEICFETIVPPENELCLYIIKDLTLQMLNIQRLRRQSDLNRSVAEAASLLFSCNGFNKSVTDLLARLGHAAGLDRVRVISLGVHPSFPPENPVYAWTRDTHATKQGISSASLPIQEKDFKRWYNTFKKMQNICNTVCELPSWERLPLETQRIKWILAVPVFNHEQLWGMITYEDCRSEQCRTQEEIAALSAAARIISGLIGRNRTEEELARSLRDMEKRVRERTAELIRVNSELRVEINKRKRAEVEIKTLTMVDGLTGLYNRRGFFTLAQQQIKVANRSRRGMLLFYVDFNMLKNINDHHGHRTGDSALADTAEILKKTFRKSDIIARTGGDEFVILALETSLKDTDRLVKRLEENIDCFNLKKERNYSVSLRCGSAAYDPGKPFLINELIEKAIRSMLQQKKEHPITTDPPSNCP